MNSIGKYAFINAKVRAMLGSMLSAETIDALIHSKDIDEFCDILKGSNYHHIFSVYGSTSDLGMIEFELFKNHIQVYFKILRNLQGASHQLVFLMLNKLEIENLKNIIRCWYRKAVDEKKYIFEEKICYPIPVTKILEAKSIEELILLLNKTPYQDALLKAREQFKEKNSLFYLETALDIDYYRRLYENINLLTSSDRRIALKLMGIEIDIENILAIVRFKQYYSSVSSSEKELTDYIIPHGYKTGQLKFIKPFTADIKSMLQSLAVKPYDKLSVLTKETKDKSSVFLMEKILWEALINEAKHSLGKYPFSIGTIIAYLILKQAELKNIVSLLYSKVYKITPTEIKGKLKC
ncbi:V-type ATPase subunit [bacterium]|nr:V-type ATPase subunit [bacterium]